MTYHSTKRLYFLEYIEADEEIAEPPILINEIEHYEDTLSESIRAIVEGRKKYYGW
jgi:hypothetical protein